MRRACEVDPVSDTHHLLAALYFARANNTWRLLHFPRRLQVALAARLVLNLHVVGHLGKTFTELRPRDAPVAVVVEVRQEEGKLPVSGLAVVDFVQHRPQLPPVNEPALILRCGERAGRRRAPCVSNTNTQDSRSMH